MKRAVIYVFSGTGNTLIAARFIAKALQERDIQATLYSVRAPFCDAPQPSGYDMAFFGYPVHAFNTPRFFLQFVRSLQMAQGVPAYIFKTSGEPFRPNSASSLPLVRLLRRKGFTPMREWHLLMPYYVMFRYNDSLAKQMYIHTAKMANMAAQHAADGGRREFRFSPFTATLMMLFRLQWFGALVNGPLIRAKKGACSGCGLCAANCPAGNITMRNGRPRFGARCTMCMSCAMRCPFDAVRPGILSLWRVNGRYPFERLASDPNVADEYINADTKGYFRLFNKYYDRTRAEMEACDTSPHEGQAQNADPSAQPNVPARRRFRIYTEQN